MPNNKQTPKQPISDDLKSVYKEYISLLGAEIDDMSGLAYIHGWRSIRHEQGKILREKIQMLENKSTPTPEEKPEAIIFTEWMQKNNISLYEGNYYTEETEGAKTIMTEAFPNELYNSFKANKK